MVTLTRLLSLTLSGRDMSAPPLGLQDILFACKNHRLTHFGAVFDGGGWWPPKGFGLSWQPEVVTCNEPTSGKLFVGCKQLPFSTSVYANVTVCTVWCSLNGSRVSVFAPFRPFPARSSGKVSSGVGTATKKRTLQKRKAEKSTPLGVNITITMQIELILPIALIVCVIFTIGEELPCPAVPFAATSVCPFRGRSERNAAWAQKPGPGRDEPAPSSLRLP